MLNKFTETTCCFAELGLASLSMTEVVQPVKVLDGKKLRRQRILAGLTQAGLAEKADCSAMHVWYLENGKRDASPPMLASLARGLGCHRVELMAGEPDGNAA